MTAAVIHFLKLCLSSDVVPCFCFFIFDEYKYSMNLSMMQFTPNELMKIQVFISQSFFLEHIYIQHNQIEVVYWSKNKMCCFKLTASIKSQRKLICIFNIFVGKPFVSVQFFVLFFCVCVFLILEQYLPHCVKIIAVSSYKL